MKPWKKFTSLFRKRQLDADMNEEMREHLARLTQAFIAEGMSAEDARYAARRQFGGVEQLKEIAREQRGWLWVEQAWQDLGQTLRSLRKRPAFAVAVVVTLAAGVGLTTVQLSFVNAALWNGPASEHQLRGVMELSGIHPKGGSGYPFLLRDYLAWKASQRSFAQSAAFARTDLTVSSDNVFPREYRGVAVEAAVFPLMRAQAFLGRTILPDDERADAPTVIVLSHASWQRDFFGDRGVVDREVRVNGENVTIIGVMPEAFRFPANQEAWINLRPARAGALSSGDDRVQIIGRLAGTSSASVAMTEFNQLLNGLATADASAERNYTAATVEPLSTSVIGSGVRILLMTLLVMVLGVLALAAVNVANLLFARAVGQRSDTAIRAALGATRSRLLRQAAVEGLVFAALGSAGGMLLGVWGAALLNRRLALDGTLPAWFALRLDGPVIGAALMLSVAVGLFCSIVPMLRITRVNLAAKLKDTSGLAAGRFNRLLVGLQVALSCALLVPAGMLVKGIERSSRFAVPYDPAQVLTARISLQRPFADAAARDQFRRALRERLAVVPGVTAVAFSDRNPADNGLGSPVDLDGITNENPGTAPWGIREAVSPDYFKALRATVVEGRAFTDADGPTSERVAIVNESFARRHWASRSALGQRLRANAMGGPASTWSTVVGVVRDLPMQGPRSTRSPAGYYVPLSQTASVKETILVAMNGDPTLVTKLLPETIRSLASNVPVNAIQTVAASVQAQLSAPRAIGSLAFLFGGCALGLASIGIYGMTAYAVHRRTREIGIRVALGATRGNVLALVLRGGVLQLAIGLVGGCALGWLFSRPLLNALSAKVVASGTEIYVLVAAVISAAVALALWIPARRATKVDPLVALRTE